MLEKLNVSNLAKEYQKEKYLVIEKFLDADLAKKLFREFKDLP